MANDLADRVLDSQHVLERQVRSILDGAAACAERALVNAQGAHRKGEAAVARELSRLDASKALISRMIT